MWTRLPETTLLDDRQQTPADAYNILEKFVAGILVDKIINVKNYDSTDVSSANLKIPIDNVYSALFKNNVIELSKMEAAVEGETQHSVYQTILSRAMRFFTVLVRELLSGTIAYQSLPAEYKAYEAISSTICCRRTIFYPRR